MLNKIINWIIKNLIFLTKFFPNLIRNKIRYLIFDYRDRISNFSEQKIYFQKKELTNKIKLNNFLLLKNYIETKKIHYLDSLFVNLQKNNSKKINYIYIYSYLVNIHEFRLANIYHEKLCNIISKKHFFYFQICTLNQSNISKFKSFSHTFEFKLIYLFLYSDEKNFIKTILNINNSLKFINFSCDKKDIEFEKYLRNKKINIIGPLDKKINFSKKELKNNIIIRFKNTNYLTKKDYYPQITFLNGRASRKYLENKDYLSIDKGLLWIVYINETFYKKFKRVSNIKNRFAFNTGAVLFTCFTELNFLQKVLLDLILFNPRQIKLHNFNMYLTKRTKIGYGVNNTLKKQMNSNISFNHNQIVQFDFINFLYKKNFFSLDENLKKIIKNGKQSYLVRMDNYWKE